MLVVMLPFYECTLPILSQRILEEDEEIEQEWIRQTLDLQFHGHKQHQSFQIMEEQTYTMGAGTLPGQAILKANAPPVQYAHEHPPPAEKVRKEAKIDLLNKGGVFSEPTAWVIQAFYATIFDINNILVEVFLLYTYI